jgi:hypothetical protein
MVPKEHFSGVTLLVNQKACQERGNPNQWKELLI